jgi:hypothetical protein
MALKDARRMNKPDGYFIRSRSLSSKYFPNQTTRQAAKSFDNFRRKYRADIEKEARF